MTRFMLYSHDSFGLGHFRRSSSIARALIEESPEHEVLIATGSPLTQSFVLPERVDTLKLPAATKDERGKYAPRSLGGDITQLVHLRGELLLAAFRAYQPDVVVVDHAPIGLGGELVPTLSAIDAAPRRPRLVLGMRDVIDHAQRVHDDWDRAGIWSWLGVYDDILVYGDPRVLTTATELGVADRIRGSVHHTGYLAPPMPSRVAAARPFVLVTGGGGGDGLALIQRYLTYLETRLHDPVPSHIVTGPLMAPEAQYSLEERAGRLRGVTVEAFNPQMRELIASASAVISMAGYNTVVEELAARAPALLAPRTTPRLEQHVRAQRLEGATHLESATLESLDSDRLSAFIERSLESDRPTECGVALDGLARAAKVLTGAQAA